MDGTTRLVDQRERLEEARQALQSAHATLKSGKPVQALQVHWMYLDGASLIVDVCHMHSTAVRHVSTHVRKCVRKCRTFYASHAL